MVKTIEGDLILEENMEFEESLVVRGNIIGKEGKRFNLEVAGNINAGDIVAGNINAWNIDAWNIDAGNINAWNIDAGNIDAWNIDAWNIDAGNIDAGNINAWNIDAGNINAWNINAWDIIVEKRIKKTETSKTIARIFIENKSKLERKEW